MIQFTLRQADAWRRVPFWDYHTALEGFVGDQTSEIAAIEETAIVPHGTWVLAVASASSARIV
jgi:hypothetical protein